MLSDDPLYWWHILVVVMTPSMLAVIVLTFFQISGK